MRLRNSTRSSIANSSNTDKKTIPIEPITPPDEDINKEEMFSNETVENETVENETVENETVENEVETTEHVHSEAEDSDTGSDVFMPVGISMRNSETSENEDERELENDDDKFEIEDGSLQVDEKQIDEKQVDEKQVDEKKQMEEKTDNNISISQDYLSVPVDNTESCTLESPRSDSCSDVSEKKDEEIIGEVTTKLGSPKDTFMEGNIFSKSEIFFGNHTKDNNCVENNGKDTMKNDTMRNNTMENDTIENDLPEQGIGMADEQQDDDGEHNISDDFMM